MLAWTYSQVLSPPHVVPRFWLEPVEASDQSIVPLYVRVRSSHDSSEKYFLVGGLD